MHIRVCSHTHIHVRVHMSECIHTCTCKSTHVECYVHVYDTLYMLGYTYKMHTQRHSHIRWMDTHMHTNISTHTPSLKIEGKSLCFFHVNVNLKPKSLIPVFAALIPCLLHSILCICSKFGEVHKLLSPWPWMR